MNRDELYRITAERIAANRDKAVRNLVRNNGRLADEVRYLRAVVEGQDSLQPCKGCVRWHNVDNFMAYCDLASTPEPWYSAAFSGGEPGCPNYITQRRRNPIKPCIALLLINFKDGIRNIDRSLADGNITDEDAHQMKIRLADIYTDIIVHQIEEEGMANDKD